VSDEAEKWALRAMLGAGGLPDPPRSSGLPWGLPVTGEWTLGSPPPPGCWPDGSPMTVAAANALLRACEPPPRRALALTHLDCLLLAWSVALLALASIWGWLG
jgi:hypothetical protein